jgi:hypothetical protein
MNPTRAPTTKPDPAKIKKNQWTYLGLIGNNKQHNAATIIEAHPPKRTT